MKTITVSILFGMILALAGCSHYGHGGSSCKDGKECGMKKDSKDGKECKMHDGKCDCDKQ